MAKRFLHVADLDMDRCCVVYVQIDFSVDNRESSKVGVQQKLCREFLDKSEFRGCLVSPLRELSQINIIGPRNLLDNESEEATFNRWLRDRHITIISTVSLSSQHVVDALQYTAPIWLEKSGWQRFGHGYHFLVGGDMFLGDAQQLKRVELDFLCSAMGRVSMRLGGDIVAVYRMEPWRLKRNVHGAIDSQQWVTCLPKLTKGRIIAVYNSFPNNSPFRNYGELRSYWKNCYGYNLPASEPECYYDVRFGIGKEAFLYPAFCILEEPPTPVRFLDDKPNCEVLDAFCKDLTNAMGHICGRDVQFGCSNVSNHVEPKIITGLGITVNKRKPGTYPVPMSNAELNPRLTKRPRNLFNTFTDRKRSRIDSMFEVSSNTQSARKIVPATFIKQFTQNQDPGFHVSRHLSPIRSAKEMADFINPLFGAKRTKLADTVKECITPVPVRRKSSTTEKRPVLEAVEILPQPSGSRRCHVDVD